MKSRDYKISKYSIVEEKCETRRGYVVNILKIEQIVSEINTVSLGQCRSAGYAESYTVPATRWPVNMRTIVAISHASERM